MASFQSFARLRKIETRDDDTLEVEGIASTETPDRQGEIVLSSAIKEALPDFFAHGSGALRQMHQLSAVGKVETMTIDGEKRTHVKALVVDPIAIRKVETGVFKGFSIGGKVLARDKKDPKVITKISLAELSLVDRPANSEAVLTLWKADGLVDVRPSRGVDLLTKVDDQLSSLEATVARLADHFHKLSRQWDDEIEARRREAIAKWGARNFASAADSYRRFS